MANTTGILIRTLPGGRAHVVADKQGSCSSCSSAKSCHTAHAAKKLTTTVINRIGAEPGDIVAIDVSSGKLLGGLAVIYLLPVLGLLTGAVIGTNVKEIVSLSETGSVLLFGGIGLALGFGLVFTISKLLAANDAFTPVINRVIRKGAVQPVIDQPARTVPTDCACTNP